MDDYPYGGGGAGMVLKPEPIFRAMDEIVRESGNEKPRVLFMTPQGRTFNQGMAWSLSEADHLVFHLRTLSWRG